jgi:Carbohydrate binding domain
VNLPAPPRVSKAFLVLICLGIILIYVGRVVRVYLAQRSADSLQVADLERAIRLVPDDAEFPHLLGLRLSLSDQDDQSAIGNLRKAVSLNPDSGRYWLDLASVYQVTGNAEKQNQAVDAALNAEPGNPQVAAEAAQLFLVDGEVARALPLFRQALVQNPDAVRTILPVCWRATHDAKLLLADVVPGNPNLQLEFLGMMTQQNETEAAQQIWQHLVASHISFYPQLSFFYFEYLRNQHEVPSFNRAWHELADLAPEMRAYLPTDNLIVNGGFEQPFLNAGFDWEHQTADHIAVGIDDNMAHSGARSLSLSFDGSPAYEAGWAEFVPVQPNTEYEFSAWVKSDNVTSSSGPRIALVDAYSGDNLLLTDDVLDTHPWHELKGTIRVPAKTELLEVKITRAPANTRIRGQVWIDDLRLVKR